MFSLNKQKISFFTIFKRFFFTRKIGNLVILEWVCLLFRAKIFNKLTTFTTFAVSVLKKLRTETRASERRASEQPHSLAKPKNYKCLLVTRSRLSNFQKHSLARSPLTRGIFGDKCPLIFKSRALFSFFQRGLKSRKNVLKWRKESLETHFLAGHFLYVTFAGNKLISFLFSARIIFFLRIFFEKWRNLFRKKENTW